MARPLRLEFADAVYHVFARGNAKQPIYLDDRDCHTFLSTLWQVCERLDWQVWAFCLLNNHYHLLVKTRAATLARGMRDLNGTYAQAFNRRHDRVGHLFQGRYASRLVDELPYVMQVARYIVLNPIEAKLCRSPEEWRWSSYRITAAGGDKPEGLVTDQVLGLFGDDLRTSTKAYVEFVAAGMVAADAAAGTPSIRFLGDDQFVRDMARRAGPISPEVPRPARPRISISGYREMSPTRDDAIRAAYASGDYSQAEIARHFGVHYSTVSRVIGNSSFRRTSIQDLTPQ